MRVWESVGERWEGTRREGGGVGAGGGLMFAPVLSVQECVCSGVASALPAPPPR